MSKSGSSSLRGSTVTVTFELPIGIDPIKFIGWVQTEVEMGNDHLGVHNVQVLRPITIAAYGDEQDLQGGYPE